MLSARLLLVSAALDTARLVGADAGSSAGRYRLLCRLLCRNQGRGDRAARAAFERTATPAGRHDGFFRVEFFEQIGRPGHFAVVETWRDQKAFDARDVAAGSSSRPRSSRSA